MVRPHGGSRGDRWDAPGLGEWDVRALVGHTRRSLLTVETYLARPTSSVDIPSPADYVRATCEIAAGAEVAQRGRDAGAALGDGRAGHLLLAATGRRDVPGGFSVF